MNENSVLQSRSQEVKFGLAADSFNEEEIQAVLDVMRSGKYTMGEKVKEFERELAEWLGMRETVMVNSGSSANLLLVEALLRRTQETQECLVPGDEVLVPALSWPTTVWPLVQLGLIPVFVDINPQTLAIDLKQAHHAVTDKTKGLFLIHAMGYAADMDLYVDFCKNHNLVLIEDCCEAFGAFSHDKSVGSSGLGGAFSHFFSHHLTTIEGGSIATNDSNLADDLRSFRAHGWIRDRTDKEQWIKKYSEFDPRFLFISTGYNVRPMELQAAIGLVQIKKMDQFLKKREELAKYLLDVVQKYCPWLELIGSETLSSSELKRTERKHSWMFLPFRIKHDNSSSLKRTRTDVCSQLEKKGVDTRTIIAGNLVRHPALKKIPHRVAGSLDHSDQLLDNGFMIGCHSLVTEQQLVIIEESFRTLK